MPCNQTRSGGVDIVCPLGRVLIRSITDIRKETEFQMIVGVDQPGQQKIAREVKVISEACQTSYRPAIGLGSNEYICPRSKPKPMRLNPAPVRSAFH